MDLTEQRVAMALAPRAVKFFASVASTNDIAREWLQQGALKGAVVVADEQTAGRGRMERTWSTPPGVALALSVVLRVPPPHLPQVNMMGTLAVYSLLEALNISDLAIKWSNDVLAGGKKISGILPEAVWNGDQLEGVVLGIGLNVANDFSGTELETIATSLQMLTGRTQDRAALLAVLMFQLDHWLEKLNKLGTSDVTTAYKLRMPMLGHSIQVKQDATLITGTATDVRNDGALLITQADGTVVPVYAGDVTVVGNREA